MTNTSTDCETPRRPLTSRSTQLWTCSTPHLPKLDFPIPRSASSTIFAAAIKSERRFQLPQFRLPRRVREQPDGTNRNDSRIVHRIQLKDSDSTFGHELPPRLVFEGLGLAHPTEEGQGERERRDVNSTPSSRRDSSVHGSVLSTPATSTSSQSHQ